MIIISESILDFIDMIEEIGGSKYSPSFFIGEITNIVPLKIKFNEIEIVRDQMLFTSTLSNIASTFKKGDMVILFLNDDGTIVLIDKVVR